MNRFYDIHCHMMNLSHPNILAFLGRVDLRLAILAGSFIGPLVTFFAGRHIKRILNLLAVMENDAANLFLLLEYSLTAWETADGRPPPIFEIYPFLGINTKNYTTSEVEALLQKYFSEYTGNPTDIKTMFGAFDGDIDAMRSHWFAGIKVYPPLGFDPWPEHAPDPDELAKVRLLYRCCTEKQIPLTAHCSDGGFVVDPDGMKFTAPDRWRPVLEAFPTLKLNLAHMGTERKRRFGIIPKRGWQKEVFELIAAHENVYTDISCCAFDDGFYKNLRKLLDTQPPKARERLLFGSDFMVNLLWSDSYNDYLTHFGDTAHLSDADREHFCRENPERFLFH